MRKLLLFLITWAITGSYCNAQNFQCVQPGAKRFFISPYGYLKGMRIDSVLTNGTMTVLKPFKTDRAPVTYPATGPSLILDSMGASWMGKSIIMLADGTTMFDNFLHDTVVIKTRAGIGSTWTMYSDSASIHYDATVYALDTMTVLGALDSVKKISIVAKNTANVMVADSLNSLKLVLSKNHGFVNVFDIYLFPYKKPTDNGFNPLIDFYFHQMSRNVGVALPNVAMQTYSLIADPNPKVKDIYDYNANDVYEWKNNDNYNITYCIDTISNKVTTPGMVIYTWSPICHMGLFDVYRPITVYDTSYLFPVKLMPEESGQVAIYKYFPNDTSLCKTSDRYEIISTWVGIQLHQSKYFEPILIVQTYKKGLGNIHNYAFNTGDLELYDREMDYYHTSSSSCNNSHLGIADFNLQKSIRVSPIPADATLNIELQAGAAYGNYRLWLTDMMGRILKSTTMTTSSARIEVNNIPEGIYFLNVRDSKDGRLVRKVEVRH